MKQAYRLGMLAAITACAIAPGAALAKPQVEQAWVRLAAVPGRPAGGYFTLRTGPAADTLVTVKSAVAARIQLHETTMANGMMAMRPIGRVVLKPNDRLRFAPGGSHAMIFGVKPSVKPGGTMPLRFVFASGQTLDVDARVIAAGDSPPR